MEEVIQKWKYTKSLSGNTQKLKWKYYHFDDEAWQVGQEKNKEDHGEHLQKSLEKNTHF